MRSLRLGDASFSDMGLAACARLMPKHRSPATRNDIMTDFIESSFVVVSVTPAPCPLSARQLSSTHCRMGKADCVLGKGLGKKRSLADEVCFELIEGPDENRVHFIV